ncbi:MAG: hypothetical protein IPP29_00420 [Bacteroidetes bacterium]|nr:hypothetical protein [Bacteroidota bacterium]
MSVLNMLNTKYFIVSPKEGQPPMAQMNPEHCGSAWFVPEFKIVANADEESKSLEKFNLVLLLLSTKDSKIKLKL